ncbi:MAG: hypothetical protein IJJ98_06985, partial [Prevotella sp.]|nr:hypothetical protein [Prevotella sp.]
MFYKISAILTCFQSNAPAKRKLCSGKSKAMLGQIKSYAPAKQKQFTIFEDVGTRRAALLEGEKLIP